MAKAIRITDEQIEKASAFIRSMPVKSGNRQDEAAMKLAPAIRVGLKRGYSLKEIQDAIFNEVGIRIQMSKLKKALTESESSGPTVETSRPASPKAEKLPAAIPSPQADDGDAVQPDKPKIIMPFRVSLNCPKEEKDEAKGLGAKWDASRYVWYVPAGNDLTPFEKWLTKPLQKYQSGEVTGADESVNQSTFSETSFVRPDIPDDEL